MAKVDAGTLEALFRLRDELSPAVKTINGVVKEADKLLDQYAAKLGPAGGALKSLGASGLAAAAGIGAVVVAAVAAGKAIVDATARAIEMGARFQDMSEDTNVLSETLMAIEAASGIDTDGLEAFASGLKKLNIEMVNSPEKFKQLGLNVQDLMAMKPEERFEATAKAILNLGSDAERTAATMAVFGKAMPLHTLKDFADIQQKMARSRGLGLTIDSESTASLKAMSDELGVLGKAWDMLLLQVGAAIASTPGLSDAVAGVTDAVGGLVNQVKDSKGGIQDFVQAGVIPALGVLERLIQLLGLAASGFSLAMEKAKQNQDALLAGAQALAAGLPGGGFLLNASLAAGAAGAGTLPPRPPSVSHGSLSQFTFDPNAAEAARKAAEELRKLNDAQEKVNKSTREFALAIEMDKFSEKIRQDTEVAAQLTDQLQKQLAAQYGLLEVAGKLEGSAETNADYHMTAAEEADRQVKTMIREAELAKFHADQQLAALDRLRAAGQIGEETYQRMKTQIDSVAASAHTLGDSLRAAVTDLPNVILGAIQGGGNVGQAIGAHLGATIGKDLGQSLANTIGGTLGKTLGSFAGPLGSLLGGGLGKLAGKLFGGLFGGGEVKKVNDLRDAFFDARGGYEAFAKELSGATNKQLVKKIFDAKTVKEFEAAVKEAQDALDLHGEAQEKLNAAVEKYGFTIEELGPKFQQQKLDEMAGGLIEDFRLLTASGIDQVAVLQRMGPAFSEYVQTAIRAGAALPETMRPMIEQLIQSGQLLDENGNAFTSAEEAGISFTQTLSEGLREMIDSINKLVAALTGVGTAAGNIRFPPAPNYGGGDPGGGKNGDPLGDVPVYDVGTPYVPQTGLAYIHRGEAIIPADQNTGGRGGGGNTEINLGGVSFGDILIPPGTGLDPQQVAQAFGVIVQNNLNNVAERLKEKLRL